MELQAAKIEKSKSQSHRNWYLVYCKPSLEETAEENLSRQGYDVYLPMTLTRRRRKTRYEIVNAPLFPRYLFIQLCPESDDWGPIRFTTGVSTIVRFGKVIAQVPNGLIESLKTFGERGDAGKESTQFKLGDNVRIISGIAKDYHGVIICKSSKERVVLLMKTVTGYTAKMQIPTAWLEEASS